jgi:flagellar biosynthesis anti-sigma factor FlgM
MNPLSSIPSTPPGAPSSHHKNTITPAQDSMKDAPALPSSPPTDIVSLSFPTQDLSHYLEGMAQIPDVRQARITQIQKALDSHTYGISPEDLADKILQELPSNTAET